LCIPNPMWCAIMEKVNAKTARSITEHGALMEVSTNRRYNRKSPYLPKWA
jgi:hypothetical protein